MRQNRTDADRISAAVAEKADVTLLVLLGFDGVLVDYESDPAAVRLPPERCEILTALTARRDVALGIVSGRRIEDLKLCAPLHDRAYYIGLHGLEIEGPGLKAVRKEILDAYRDRVRDIEVALQPQLSPAAGIYVENKEAAIAVHTREAGPGDAVWARIHLLSAATALGSRDELRVVRGNHVIELLPNVISPRATAVERVQQHLERARGKPVFTLYVGEDVPDDDAFDAIEGRGVSAAVGNRAPKARYHLSSTADVWAVIDRLTATRESAA